MGRPRKDGATSVPPVRIGHPRTGADGRVSRTRAYLATPGAPHGRVVFRDATTGRDTSACPAPGEDLDGCFDRIEMALDTAVATAGGRRPAPEQRRDIAALGALYLERLRAKGNDPGYIANRACLLRVHIVPVIGDVLVADWTADHSVEVLQRASEVVGRRTVDGIRSTLSGMRRTAWLRRSGGRWLPRTEDPLEDVDYRVRSTVQGTSTRWVPPHLRPATERVEAAIAAAADPAIARWDWMTLCIRLAAFCGLRLSEQLGLRVVDVDLESKTLDVNGVWLVDPAGFSGGARRRRHRRPHPKNKMRRTVPYLGSLDSVLVSRMLEVLDLGPGTGRDEVTAWVLAERQRRLALTQSGDWRDCVVGATDEMWLFADPDERMPPTKEMFNDAWHAVRDASGWTRTIAYRNMRHHACCWLHDRGWGWEQIALWTGHDHRTLTAYYVLPSEDLNRSARPLLDRW